MSPTKSDMEMKNGNVFLIAIIISLFSSSQAQTRTILITGSTDGIGQEAALELAANPDNHIIVHGRNESRCKQTVQYIKQANPNSNVDYVVADFNRLQNILDLANEVQRRFPRLNVLIDNAGVWLNQRQLSQDGLEMTFQVNHLASFLLTNKLLPLLKQNRPSRVVVVSSGLYNRFPIDWNDLQAERGYNGMAQYSRTKTMNHLFTFALARRFANDRDITSGSMTANVMEPGGVATHLFGGPRQDPRLNKASLEAGAASVVYLAQSPDVDGVNGQFYNKFKQQVQASDATRNETAQESLWQISVNLLKEKQVW